jgi:hypothetical protein
MLVTAGQFLAAIGITAATISVIYAVLIWLGGRWIDARIKSRFDRLVEDYRFELKANEQGAKIAEYAAISVFLQVTDSPELYRRANQLSWELFLWLPPEVYRQLARGLAHNTEETAAAFIEVRRLLLGARAGDLGPNDLIFHAPGAGAGRR